MVDNSRSIIKDLVVDKAICQRSRLSYYETNSPREDPFFYTHRATLLLGILVLVIPRYALGYANRLMPSTFFGTKAETYTVKHYNHHQRFFTHQGANAVYSHLQVRHKYKPLQNSLENGDSYDDDHDEEKTKNKNKSDENQKQTSFYQDEDCLDLCEETTNEFQDPSYYSSSSSSPTSVNNSDTIQKLEETSRKMTTSSNSNKISPKQMMKNIELRWSIEESNHDCDVEDISSCSDPCIQCHGIGTAECTFCSGSGYIDLGVQEIGTMGDQLVKQNGGKTGIECPVCNENGDQVCSTCMGSGYIARWRMNFKQL